MNKKIKIGITHGDYNGIGYEVIIKTLSDPRILELFTPVIYGSMQLFNYHKKSIGVENNMALSIVSDIDHVNEDKINLYPVDESDLDLFVQFGVPSRSAGAMASRALMDARAHLLDNRIDAVVTAPINKDTIQSKEFNFYGHTEFFSEPFLGTHEPTMIFTSDTLRVALVTMHTPLSEVPNTISSDQLIKRITGLTHTLQQDFGIMKPRVAVLGLNPHAGENGLLGKEELNIITPAIEHAWQSGSMVFGPFPADGLWGSGGYAQFDAVLAMYHDQGLIPFKLIAMDSGVNITAGLPIIRTSPDHGTGYDIAGKGIANENSLRSAIYAAIDIYHNRFMYKEMTSNPLKKRYVERDADNVQLDFSKSEDTLE